MDNNYKNYFDDSNDDLYESSKRSKNFKVNINEDNYYNDDSRNTGSQFGYTAERGFSGSAVNNGYDDYGLNSRPDYSDIGQDEMYDSYSGNYDGCRKNSAVRTSDGDIYELHNSGGYSVNEGYHKKVSSRDKGCLSAFIYAVCVCLASVFLSYWFIVGCNDMFALKKEDAEVILNVPKGSDLDAVTKLLKDNGIIEYPGFFKFYAHITKDDTGFKHGEFLMSTKTDYSEIIRKLTNPASSDGSTVKVVFPEGLTVEQYAELLEENNVCTKEAFFNRMTSTVYNYWFLDGVYPSTNDEGALNLDETQKIYLLEGYLFPDTYEFYINEGSKSAVNKMLNNFNSKIDSELKDKIKSSKWSVDQIITIASIIERETNVPEEMPKVASVLYNRLNNSEKFPNLQSDATRAYPYAKLADAPEGFKGKYDTYEIKGLPAGAICNPGINAIKAAVSPANTDYYYFYMDKDGKHYYSKTLNEHEAVIEKCKQNGTAQ